MAAPQLPTGLTPKAPPATREAEEALVRKAYNDARQHVRNYKKAVGEITEQRKALAAQKENLTSVMKQLDKADEQLAAEETKLGEQTRILDENLAELKKVVDGLDKK